MKKSSKKNSAKKSLTVKEAIKLINKGQRMLHHSGRVLHVYYLNKMVDKSKEIEVQFI